ncbi:MAG: HIT domain-containing protein [Candidatus Omnitrophica bacterium]|nr:HIT domain-containing protein [Candidatus Omnitrophota bacterium]
MDKLWAPWRKEYIQGLKKQRVCIFCKKDSNRDKADFVIKRNEYCFSMLNIYPYNNGHILIAPYRHIADFNLLNKSEALDIMELIKETVSVLKKVLKPSGFNIGLNLGRISGAGFERHLHFHIVPRWNGDTNFMPVISSTKVISESLNELYRRLREEYDKKGRT